MIVFYFFSIQCYFHSFIWSELSTQLLRPDAATFHLNPLSPPPASLTCPRPFPRCAPSSGSSGGSGGRTLETLPPLIMPAPPPRHPRVPRPYRPPYLPILLHTGPVTIKCKWRGHSGFDLKGQGMKNGTREMLII